MDNITNHSDAGGMVDDSQLRAIGIFPQWVFNVELTLMAIVFLLGIPGNTIIVIVQAKIPNKTSTDWLVLIMAIYELLCSCVNTVLKMVHGINAVWLVVSSVFVCKITPFLYYMAAYGSAQTLGMLAVDRCIKTVLPLSTWYGKNQAIGVSVAIFVISMTLSFPRAITYTMQKSSSKCAFTTENWILGKYLGVAGSILSAVIFVVLSLSYLLIAVSLRKRHLGKIRQRIRRLNARDSGISTRTSKQDSMTTGISSLSDFQENQDKNCTANGNGERIPKTTDPANDVRNIVKTNIKAEEVMQTSIAATSTGRSKMLTLEGKNLDRVTVLMFMISLIYVGTNSILWYLFITNPFALGLPVLRLSFAVPMLNCISNPIMFFTMSSRFRHNVKTLLRCQ